MESLLILAVTNRPDMPRKTPLNDTVKYTNSLSVITGRPHFETNDCVPVAISIAFNVSYMTARDWCEKYMKRTTGNGVARHQHDAFMSNKELLAELGYKVTDLQWQEAPDATTDCWGGDDSTFIMYRTRGRKTDTQDNCRTEVLMRYNEWWLENRRHTGRFPILRMALRMPKGRIFGVVKGHAMSMVDGEVFDNSNRVSGRHNMERAYLVEKI